jgi:periplasmic copper chaperone A
MTVARRPRGTPTLPSRPPTARRALVGAVAVVVVLVIWAGAAGAHVTVSPSSVPAGTSDAILTFRVPNESPLALVTGLRVQFPIDHPIVIVSPQAGSGWTVSVQTTQLAKPITTDDGTFTATVSEVDWSGGTIPVGQFGAFDVLAQGFPSGTDRLVFKAIQQYSDGTTVSWIQVPDRAAPNPPHPAPILSLTSGRRDTSGAAAPAGTNAAGSQGTSSGNGHVLAVVALVVAGFAAVLALLAVWLGRPRVFSAQEPVDTHPVGAGTASR